MIISLKLEVRENHLKRSPLPQYLSANIPSPRTQPPSPPQTTLPPRAKSGPPRNRQGSASPLQKTATLRHSVFARVSLSLIPTRNRIDHPLTTLFEPHHSKFTTPKAHRDASSTPRSRHHLAVTLSRGAQKPNRRGTYRARNRIDRLGREEGLSVTCPARRRSTSVGGLSGCRRPRSNGSCLRGGSWADCRLRVYIRGWLWYLGGVC